VGFISLEEGVEMKKSLIICIAVSLLYPLSVSAQDVIDRYVDILEPGNPGGWENSLKTWDVVYTVTVGDTVEFDVWLSDTGNGFWEASYFAAYVPTQLSIFGVEAYDGVSLPGPWDPEEVLIDHHIYGSDAYCLVDLYNLDCAQPDSNGHMILARGWIESKACGDATIVFSDIPAL